MEKSYAPGNRYVGLYIISASMVYTAVRRGVVSIFVLNTRTTGTKAENPISVKGASFLRRVVLFEPIHQLRHSYFFTLLLSNTQYLWNQSIPKMLDLILKSRSLPAKPAAVAATVKTWKPLIPALLEPFTPYHQGTDITANSLVELGKQRSHWGRQCCVILNKGSHITRRQHNQHAVNSQQFLA